MTRRTKARLLLALAVGGLLAPALSRAESALDAAAKREQARRRRTRTTA
jgi:hypothetical protein